MTKEEELAGAVELAQLFTAKSMQLKSLITKGNSIVYLPRKTSDINRIFTAKLL